MSPAPLFVSSGDLLADRRYERARALADEGDLVAAADLLTQTLERAPGFASSWFALGDLHARRGDTQGAIAAFRKALETDPADRHGAALHLARLGAFDPAAAMSPDYVRALFDQYAPDFDQALVERLNYRAPDLLRSAVETVCASQNRPLRFARTLDLGCGTGLAGAAFRDCCETISGVDLSAKMLDVARRKGIYDRLVADDMRAFLECENEAACNIIVAADAFVYLADLAPICNAAARVLAPGGLLAFTVETHDGGGVILGEKQRYAHASDHVRAAIAQAGADLIVIESISARSEGGVPVPGLLAVARRKG